jgi:hypothetical protein
MTPPESPRVLIATTAMSARSGTDLYTRDLALALLRRGWLPIVYTSDLGPPAEELRRATIPVIDDIDSITARPDVIHGHHALELLTVLARFRDVPAVFVCHDALSWHSIPPRSSRIRSWVAVDRNCRDRMLFEHAVPEESIHLFTNAVDLGRFRRRALLPASPRRALVFNNAAVETGSYVTKIRAACAQRGITVDVLGELSGRASWNPEHVLPDYDLVFARARCALEAAAVGTAVVLCDPRALGGMLTAASLDAMRALNFGARTLQLPVTEQHVLAEIDRYDAADAAAVSDRIRASATIDVLADQYIALYEQLMQTPVPPLAAETELAEMASALSAVTRRIRLREPLPRRRLALLNSRLLAPFVRVLQWLKRRLEL